MLINPLQNNLVELENHIATLKGDISSQQASTSAMPDSILGVPNFIKSGNQAAVDGLKQQLDQQYALASQYQNRIDQLQGMKEPASALPNKGWGFTPKATITGNVAAEAAAVAEQKKIDSVTKSLDLQLKTLTETDRQKAIDTELSKAGVMAATNQGKAIEALAGKFYDEKKAITDANTAASFFAQTTETAFEGIITGSSSVQDALSGIVKALAQAVIQAELLGSGPLAGILGTSPTTSGTTGGILGSLFSALVPHANGGVYSSPSLSAYSNQVVTKPTMFAFANGGVPNLGVFAERGPEAIMPLKMGANGQLGVQAAANSNGGTTITNHYHIDATGAEIGVEQKIVNALKVYDQGQPVRVQQIMADKRAR